MSPSARYYGANMPIVLLMDSVQTTAVLEEDDLDFAPEDDSIAGVAEAFLNRISKAVLLAIVVAVSMAVVVAAGIGEEQQSGSGDRLGGDFAAFYAAGSIVWSGDIDSLYDPARQEEAQANLGLDGYLAFAYPPHVATAYAPLGALEFTVAYAIHTMFMAGALVLSLWLLSSIVPLIARWRWPLLAASLTFYPLATAIGGGQNAALSLLGLAVVWRALHDDREWLAGLATGLMMFRPQYGLPLVGLMLLARHWHAVATAVATVAATWLLTAVALGSGWVSIWWSQVVPFVEQDAEVNASNSISILGFLQAAWSPEARPAVVAGAIGAAVVVVTLMFLWFNPTRFTLANRMGATAIGITLISPHTMFYDAGLLVIAGAAIMATEARVPARVLALTWAASLVHLAGSDLGATPLAVVVGVCFVAMVIHAISSNTSVAVRTLEGTV